MHYPTVVFIRAHLAPEFVADTIDSLRFYARTPLKIIVTVDRNPRIAEVLKSAYPDVLVYTSSSNCGWGGGLFRLFCEAVRWTCQEQNITFDYLWNVDYDMIATREGWDVHFLPRFDASNVGQVGKINKNSQYWHRKVRQNLGKLKLLFTREGKVWPAKYRVGEHVAGACSLFKGACVAQMLSNGLMGSPFCDLGETLKLADDPLLSMFTAAAGYEIRDLGSTAFIKWKMDDDYRRIPAAGYYLYHPTKLVPGNQVYSLQQELTCRNFFRGLRGQPAIKMLADTPTHGKPNSMVC